MYIFYRAWECRAPLTQSLLLGPRQSHPGCWRGSLVSCSCRLVIHPGAACRGREGAEEILPAPCPTCGAARSPACLLRTRPAASPPSRGARAARSLSGRRTDTSRARRRGLRFLQALRAGARSVSVLRSTAPARPERVRPSRLRCACRQRIQPQGELIPGCRIILPGSSDLGEQPVEYLPTCSSMNPSYSIAKSCRRFAADLLCPGM